MSQILNDRDALLQAAVPRVLSARLASIVEDFSSALWSGASLVTIGDGAAGSSARRSTGSSILQYANFFAIDRTRTYRTRFWARASADANGVLYHDLRQYTGQSDQLAGPVNGGRAPYKPSNIAKHTDWREYDYTWSAADWQAGVTHVRPDFLLNYLGTAGYWEVQAYTFTDATDVMRAYALADAANLAAFNAQQSANQANAALTIVGADNQLSKGEKPGEILRWNTIVGEFGGLQIQADNLGVNHVTIDNAYSALFNHLSSLNTAPAWTDVLVDTPIDGALFRTKFLNYFNAKAVLLNAVAAKIQANAAAAATTSTWAGTTGPGKPEDYATYLPPGKGSAINDDPAIEKPSAWSIPAGLIIATGTSAVGAAGNSYFYASGYDGTDRAAFSARAHAVDPNLVYNLTANLYAANGNNRGMYIAVNCYDSAGLNIANNGWGGTYTGYTFGGVPPVTGQWVRCGEDFGAGTARPLPANTRSIKIGVWFQYTGAGSSSVAQAAQDIRLVEITSLFAISSDNILSRGEKPQVILDYNTVLAEYAGIEAQADALGVPRTVYDTATGALSSYLMGLAPAWNDTTRDTTIVGATFRTKFSDYYTAKEALRTAIAAKAATQANSDGIITAPGGGILIGQNGGMNGAIKIRLPQSWAGTMLKFTVDIFEYLPGYSCVMDIAGYNYTGGYWANVTARVRGGSNVEYPVYFGHDGTKCCIWIGNASESWSYPQVRVKDVFLGFTNTSEAMWASGWQISFDTAAAAGVTASVLDTLPGADWSKIPNRAGRPADNATADIVLIGSGVTLNGNVATKTGGSSGVWDASVRSQDSAPFGAIASAVISQTTAHIMFGLNGSDAATDSGYTNIDFAIYVRSDARYDVYESGTSLTAGGGFGDYVAGDQFGVLDDGSSIRYLKNGVNFFTSTLAASKLPNKNLYFDSSFYTGGGKLSNIRFNAQTSNNWVSVGGPNKPADNATVGATFGSNVFGQITAGNVGTYLALAAIGSAYIADLRTANYSEDGNGNATAGAKLSSTGTALKVANNSLQVGSAIFSDYWFRLVQGIDGSVAAGKVIWRGNNDSTTRGGAPNIACLAITAVSSQLVQSNFQQIYHSYKITPSSYAAYTDNLDAMCQIHVQLFQSSSSSSPFTEFYQPCPSRTYDGSTGAVQGSWHWGWRYSGTGSVVSGSLETGNVYSGYMRVRLANSYGFSAAQDFAPASSGGQVLSATTISGTAPPPSGGGGGSGGGCPAPWVKVTLLSGKEVNAGGLYNGAVVAAVDDNTMQPLPNGGTVRGIAVIWAQRYRVKLADGAATEWSENHRFAVKDRGWVHVQNLLPGDHILGLKEGIVDSLLATGEGQVVSFEVEGGGTYFAGGLLCHNIKNIP